MPRIEQPESLRTPKTRFKLFLLLILGLNLVLTGTDEAAGWPQGWPLTTSTSVARASNGSTALEVRATDTATGQPVAGASVTTSLPNLSGQADRDGFLRLDNLTAPDRTRLDVTVSAPGYATWTIQGVYLLSADTLRIQATLTPGDPTASQTVQNLAPRWLTNSPKTGPEPGPEKPQARFSRNYSDSNPPSTIRVYRAATGTVDTVDFTFYMKHVLPSEWIPSWLPASLQAGAMAVKTYGWYWTNFSKYPGQNYDVKDNYADMAYNPNTSYTSTDNAVDAVASYRMLRSSAIFQAHFCAGVQGNDTRTDTQCGNTAGDWLSQWGSQDYAQQGRDFAWILNFYYDNITLTATVGQPEAVVDNTGSGAAFRTTYTTTDWQSASNCSSVNNTFLYAPNTQTQTASHNEVYWTPNLPQAGYYDVWVNVPGCSATTTNARYQVHSNGGSVTTVAVNQYNVTGFTKIGNWLFQPDATSFVYLDNVTGETTGSTRVGADTVKWVYTGPPPVVTLSSISVSPTNATINRAATRQFTATGNLSNGSTTDLTGSVSWTSSNTGVATISAGGLATGTGGGSTTISASLGGVTGTASLVVNYSIGEGSNYSQVFNDAYTRRGGQTNLGLPTAKVGQYAASGVYWQPVGGQGNRSGLGGIFHHEASSFDPSVVRAYVISGGSYQFYINNGGPSNAWGPPTSDEFQNSGSYWQVNFANGYFADSASGIHYTAWPTSFAAWKASYFNNANLASGPSLVQNEGTTGGLDSLAFTKNWGTDTAPAPQQGLLYTSNWSARWEQTYTFPAGYYKFTVCGDDGVRLTLGGQGAINEWGPHSSTCYNYIANYTASTAVPIKVEYSQATGPASLSFSVAAVTPTLVRQATDDGATGTLSNLLTNATSGTVIGFASGITTINFPGSSPTLPPVKAGVSLVGRCGSGGPQIILNLNNTSGNGLTLQGNTQVSGLWVKKATGILLLKPFSTGETLVTCVRASRS